MGYASTSDPVFRNKVACWIAEQGEVLALIRYSHRAGKKDFEFFTGLDEFQRCLRESPERTCITVFRERQLPLRGRVDDAFIHEALKLIPNGIEYVVTALERRVIEPVSWFPSHFGETSTELAEHLEDMRSALVAVGAYPPWLHDNDDVISAVVPEADGSVVTGVY